MWPYWGLHLVHVLERKAKHVHTHTHTHTETPKQQIPHTTLTHTHTVHTNAHHPAQRIHSAQTCNHTMHHTPQPPTLTDTHPHHTHMPTHVHTPTENTPHRPVTYTETRLHFKRFLVHEECKVLMRKFQEVQRREPAGFPFSRSPGHSRAPVAASGSVFTCVHTQPQGSFFPTWSYSGILGKVNSSSPQTLLRGLRARAPIALQALAAAPGRKAGLGRRSGAPSGRRSGNRCCRPGETAGPRRGPRTLAAFPGLRDGSYVSGKCMSLWASPKLLLTVVDQVQP